MSRRPEAIDHRLDLGTVRTGPPASAAHRRAPARRVVAPERPPRRLPALALLAAVAYLPALWSRPGRVVLDTYDGVHLDPSMAFPSAALRWDPVASLGSLADKTFDWAFPMSAWFWLADLVSIPTWVAHRVWLGSLILLAGTGFAFLLRTMGWTRSGWLLGALVYQSSPYILLHSGTRSVLLIAWAALPWLLAFTIIAIERQGWGAPAACALIVAAAGSVNTAATATLALGCLLWAVYVVVGTRDVPWRRAGAAVARIIALCTFVSVWWLTGVAITSSSAADFVLQADPLDAVVLAGSPADVIRGLADWRVLSTDRLPAIAVHATSPVAIALSYVIPAVALTTMSIVRFHNRLFFVACVMVGMVLSVGGFAADGTGGEPLAQLIRGVVTTGPGALLHPTTRALPLLWLGLAAGVAVAARELAAARPSLAVLGRVAIAAAALASILPFLHGTSLDGPKSLEQGVPAYWTAAAAELNAGDATRTVLELPSLSGSTYRWGRTVRPVSYTLLERPVALGDPAAPEATGTTELLQTLDERIRRDEIAGEDVVALARLLAADRIVVRDDAEGDEAPAAAVRALLAGVEGVTPVAEFGTTAAGTPALAVYAVADSPPVARAVVPDSVLATSGSAAALVDLVQTGVLGNGETMVDMEDLAASDFDGGGIRGVPFVLTDTERGDVRSPGREDRGRDGRSTTRTEWRGARDVRVWNDADEIEPAHRPALAFDGDPLTSWRTGGGEFDPRGDAIGVTLGRRIDTNRITLRQPEPDADGAAVTRATIFLGTFQSEVTLTAESWTERGQTFEFALPTARSATGEPVAYTFGFVAVQIDDVSAAPGGDHPSAALAEIAIPDVDIEELTRLPELPESIAALQDSHPLVVSTSRWRTIGTDGDPERTMVRVFELPAQRQMGVTALVTGDPGSACRDDLATLDGKPLPLVSTGEVRGPHHVLQLCAEDFVVEPGEHELRTGAPDGVDGSTNLVDHLVLRSSITETDEQLVIESTSERSGSTSYSVDLQSHPGSFWFVVGQTSHAGWRGELGDRTMNDPIRANGFATSWRQTPLSPDRTVLTARWADQRAVNVTVIASALVTLVALVLAFTARDILDRPSPRDDHPGAPRYVHPTAVLGICLGVFGIAAGPVPGIAAALLALVLEQRPRLVRTIGWLPGVMLLGAGIARAGWTATADDPASIPSSVLRWIDLLVWLGVAAAVSVALSNSDRRPAVREWLRSPR